MSGVLVFKTPALLQSLFPTAASFDSKMLFLKAISCHCVDTEAYIGAGTWAGEPRGQSWPAGTCPPETGQEDLRDEGPDAGEREWAESKTWCHDQHYTGAHQRTTHHKACPGWDYKERETGTAAANVGWHLSPCLWKLSRVLKHASSRVISALVQYWETINIG